MDSLRIALLTDGITPFVTGGMQRHSANLAKYFTLNGVQVTLVHCVSNEQVIPNDEQINRELFGENSNQKIYRIVSLKFPKSGKIPGHYVRNSHRYSKELFNHVNFSDIDFVYAKGFCGWYFMEQKRKNKNLPPIGVKFHGYEMFQELPNLSQKIKANILKKATIWNNRNADFIFSYGGKITDLVTTKMNIARNKIWDFTSGIDENWLRNSITEVNSIVNFVFVGRNEVRKGINELNAVINNILPNYDFRFHFIGPIPESERIANSKIVYHGELNSKKEICGK